MPKLAILAPPNRLKKLPHSRPKNVQQAVSYVTPAQVILKAQRQKSGFGDFSQPYLKYVRIV
jgi:hypothetical protein